MVKVLPFSLGDSKGKMQQELPAFDMVGIAVLLMRFRRLRARLLLLIPHCRSPYEIHRNTVYKLVESSKAKLPFSLGDSITEEQFKSYMSLLIAVLLMRFQICEEEGLWEEVLNCRSPYEILIRFAVRDVFNPEDCRSPYEIHGDVLEILRVCKELIAVLLMRFESMETHTLQ